MDHVAIGSGGVALRGRVAENFPADLEIVIAQPAVLEIADRTERLIAADVELANARRARDEIVAEVFVTRRRGVIGVGPVETVLPRTDFDEHRVAYHRIPFALV